MTPSEIAIIVQAIMLVVTGIIAWRKIRPEEKKTKADALETTTDAAGKISEMFAKAMEEIEKLRAHQEAQDGEINDLKKALRLANKERNAAFNWAARLIKQMKEIKPEIEPVEYLPPLDTESSIQAIKMGNKKPPDG